MSVSDVPLLNDYKKEFVKKRLPQTFLGGPNLRLGYVAPCYVYFLQVLVLLFPWIICGIFTIATEIGGLDIFISAPIAGSLVALCVLLIQIVHFCKSNNSVDAEEKVDLTASQHLRHLLADEDSIDFDSAFSYTTFKFIFPPLRYKLGIIYHVLFSGILCGVGVWYTLPSVLASLYLNNVGAIVAVYIFSWFSICTAHYPLHSGGIPPEVATFHSVDAYDVASLSRGFHIFIFFAFHIVQVYVPSFLAVNQVLHIVFLFLPLFWFLGLLPPFDAFFIWLAEQVLIFGLGGSPYATDARLFSSLILSGAVLVGGSFLTDINVLIAYSAGFGYLLSIDILSLISKLFARCSCKCAGKTERNSQALFYTFLSIGSIGFQVFVFLLGVLVVILGIIFREQAVMSGQAIISIEILFIVLFVLSKILQDIQRVYYTFRFFRNCAYPVGYSDSKSMEASKRALNVCGYIYMSLTSVVNPLLMTTYLCFLVHGFDSDGLPLFISALGAIHGFRMVWQRSNGSLVVFAIFGIYKLLIGFSSTTFGSFDTLSLGTQLLILDIGLDRAYKFLNNLWLVITVLVTSWTEKKQRRDSSLCLLITNIALFPFVLAIVALASALSAPVLPLFTLPIFLVGFPRPSRFWPETPGSVSASICADTCYYEKMTPGLVAALSKGIVNGKYAMSLGQGTDLPFYLGRSQDKTFWIQVLESGYGYVSVSVKGLELQETSCHALEATRLDDACQAAFEKPENASCCRSNPYPFLYALTPIDTEFIDGYSDAKNTLSGIIDYPASLQRFHSDFVKSLTWLLVHALNEKKRTQVSEIQITADVTPATEHPSKSDNRVISLVDLKAPSTGSQKVGKAKKAANGASYSSPTSGKESGKPGNLFNRKPQLADHSSPSLGSLASILASDNESPRRKPKQKQQPNQVAPLPGSTEVDDDLWDITSNLSGDSGFSISVKNVFARANATDAVKRKDSSPDRSSKDDVTGWGPVPLQGADLKPYTKLFDRSWYLHVSALMEDANWGPEEDQLLDACRDLVIACYVIVFVQAIPGRDPSTLGPGHITKVFRGDISWCPDLEWLTSRADLYDVVLRAHRYAVKMMYDRVAMGTVDDDDDDVTHDDLVTSFRELDSDWYVGPEGQASWKEAMRKGVSSLFSIAFEKSKKEYSARLLLGRRVETHICRISSASVRSMWSNLSLELLFATNDDEERYSIQAHPNLIRNLTVQAADPPLGYPIYSSPPLFASGLL